MIQNLERFAILRGLGPEELDAISKLCRTAKFNQGDRIFEAGEQASSLFLVYAGKIELRFKVVYLNAAVELVLETITGGQTIGWSALAPPHKYTLSAYAAEDCDLMRVDQAEIHRLCETNLHLGYVFMKNVARIIGERFHAGQLLLVKEIQDGLKRKDPLA